MSEPFLGIEALQRGLIANKHQLRSRYRRVFPGVYLANDEIPTLRQRTVAAWLWSDRQGVIAGLAAAALHGAKWVDDDDPIELVWSNPRAPKGITTRRDNLFRGEARHVNGMAVTSAVRTAFDIGRRRYSLDERHSLDEAVARLDALANATRLSLESVAILACRHRGAPLRDLMTALDLCDPGAQSPRETRLRLLLIRSGFPRPRTQIPVDCGDGIPRYYLDMGWEDVMIAVEYDGDHHRRNREQYAKDIRRHEELAARGWIIIRVISGDRPGDTIRRVRAAWSTRTRAQTAPSVR